MAKSGNIFKIVTGHYQSKIKTEKDDIIIAVDSGLSILREQGIKADYLIGDFDSIRAADLDWAKEEKIEIIKYPAEKDYLDTELALDFALVKGGQEIVIYNDLTGRFDHALALITLLEKSNLEGVKLIIRGQGQEVILLRAGESLRLRSFPGYLSILAVDKEAKVQANGLKYPMPDYFYRERPIGISNEFLAQRAEIEVIEGRIILILNKEDK